MIINNKLKRDYQEVSLILLMLLLAYILRTLPYWLGYPVPFAVEGMLDFGQVKYIIEHHVPQFLNSPFDYGAFPVLHLLIYGISSLGFEPLKVFLFLPQVFSVIGIIFFYLFLRKHFDKAVSLTAIFLIIVFIPHIYWSAEPMRETLGLFFFPLIIYLFDRVMSEKFRVALSLGLWSSLALMVATHYGSSIMMLGWLAFYTIFFVKPKKKLILATATILIYILAVAAYWFALFSYGGLILSALVSRQSLLLAIFAIAIVLAFRSRDKISLNFLRKKGFFILICLLSLLTLLGLSFRLVPINYPLQLWVGLIIYLILILVGFFYNQDDKIDKIILASSFFPLVWLLAIKYVVSGVGLTGMPFDPFRTLEFAIFPISVVAAKGYLLSVKHFRFVKIVLPTSLVVLSTFAYPTIFIYGVNFYGTPFYDVRSDIRFISPGVRELIDWANENNFEVVSPIAEVNAYQRVFYGSKHKRLFLWTKNDDNVILNSSYINDAIVGVNRIDIWNKHFLVDHLELHANSEGKLYIPILDSFVVRQSVPKTVKPGEAFTASISMENSGGIIWPVAFDIKLRFYDMLDDRIWGKRDVAIEDNIEPGAVITLVLKAKAPTKPGSYPFQMRMIIPGFGWFGVATPKVMIRVE